MLPQWRSTTVSLETYPLFAIFFFVCLFVFGQNKRYIGLSEQNPTKADIVTCIPRMKLPLFPREIERARSKNED